MFTRKFWLTFVVVFIALELTNYFFFGYLLNPLWNDPEVSKAFRPSEEINSKMWMGYILDLIWSFFFVFIFAKGYENKGVMEGIRFGIYIGLFYNLVVSYGNYILFPLPYKAALYPFLCGFAQVIILGILSALVYKPKQETKAAA